MAIVRILKVVGDQPVQRNLTWLSSTFSADNLFWLKKVKASEVPEEVIQPAKGWQVSTLTLAPIVNTETLGWLRRLTPPPPEEPEPLRRQWNPTLTATTIQVLIDNLEWRAKPRVLEVLPEHLTKSPWAPAFLTLAPVVTIDTLGWKMNKFVVVSEEQIITSLATWKPWLYTYVQPTVIGVLTLPILRVGS